LRALYLAWRASATESSSETRVNMGFSRATAHADVVGYEPWEGRVEVRVRSPRTVLVRVPQHAARPAVQALVDEAAVDAVWDGEYLRFDGLGTGQVASIKYPLVEFERLYRIGAVDYTSQWRGDTLLSIEPRAGRYPIYARGDLLLAQGSPAKLLSTTVRAERSASPVLW
jgi:hypothetical protein